MSSLISLNEKGLYCRRADVYIDPWRAVDHAITTHAHSDHCRKGSKNYLAHPLTAAAMRHRLGKQIVVEEMEFGVEIVRHGVRISLHPAGHLPGSAQVRLAYEDQIWLISGDYKVEDDGLSRPYEAIECTHFVSECTFGLPVFQWEPQERIIDEMLAWHARNQRLGYNSVLYGYSLGKAQRLHHLIQQRQIEIVAHATIHSMSKTLQQAGLDLALPTLLKEGMAISSDSILMMPPGAKIPEGVTGLDRSAAAMASGWTAIRGLRRKSNQDRGFTLSDHADWPGLIRTIEGSKAKKVYLTHGYKHELSRYLTERGINAQVLETAFEGEQE